MASQSGAKPWLQQIDEKLISEKSLQINRLHQCPWFLAGSGARRQSGCRSLRAVE
jgi:hypothetical protein